MTILPVFNGDQRNNKHERADERDPSVTAKPKKKFCLPCYITFKKQTTFRNQNKLK